METLHQGPTEGLSVSRLEKTAEVLFEEGLGYYYQARLTLAHQYLHRAGQGFRNKGDHDRYIECAMHLIRILAEQENTTAIGAIEKEILFGIAAYDLGVRTRSRAYYVLGICNTISDAPETLNLAHSFFQKSLDMALQSGDQECLIYPLYGLALFHYINGQYTDAEAQLEKMETLLEAHRLIDFSVSGLLLRALIDRNSGRMDAALEHIWQAYRLLRQSPRMMLYIHTVHSLGAILLQKGDYQSAAIYLRLAHEAVDHAELPRQARLVQQSLERLQSERGADVLEFDAGRDLVKDRLGRSISFDGQNILRRLFLLLLQADGAVVSKERIAREVWQENYESSVHDNKIYVTVRRLRQLLEPICPPGSSGIRSNDGGYLMDSRMKFSIAGTDEGRV